MDKRVDGLVVGAGITGLYMLHRLRRQGFSAHALEAGTEVGGAWYWNRYPGARCDVTSLDYSYSFDEQLQQEWTWTERYAGQPEILAYLKHVADRFDLRRDITFGVRVTEARFDSDSATWTVYTDQGDVVRAQFCFLATGCLSVPKVPEIPSLENFTGPVYYTANWPESGVDFTGKHVGVFGTGSSGVQVIPAIAEQAAKLTVFQRTPAFSVPAFNGPLDPEREHHVQPNYAENCQSNRSAGSAPQDPNEMRAFDVSEEERQRTFERWYNEGGIYFLKSFTDLLVDQKANDAAADFLRQKIRAKVTDPDVANLLTSQDYPLATKRLCVDTNYYETYNLDHVTLVDLRANPVEKATAQGVHTSAGNIDVDCLVLATGFDAMTGAILRIDIQGREGANLSDRWAAGPRTYLGLCTAGFPNLFVLNGPGSPSVLFNMVRSAEQHVEWITDCMAFLRERNYRSIEATVAAENHWVDHVNDVANKTLFPKAASWYMGANVPGKPRLFMPYIGGVASYTQQCQEIASAGYRGFFLE